MPRTLNTRAALAALLLCLGASRAIATPPAPQNLQRSATPLMLALPCTGCHGSTGISTAGDIPNLAGQTHMALTDALLRFRSGERPATVMGRLAKGYSETEIAALAQYFAAQPLARAPQTALATNLIARGKDLHVKHCAACHRAAAPETQADHGQAPQTQANLPALSKLSAALAAASAPILTQQWRAYLQTQMDDFSAGRRPMAPAMAEQFAPLARPDLEALAHYYASGAGSETTRSNAASAVQRNGNPP